MANGYDYRRCLGMLADQFINGQLVMPNDDIEFNPHPRPKIFSLWIQWEGEAILYPIVRREILSTLPLFGDCSGTPRSGETKITAVFSDKEECHKAAEFFHGLKYKGVEFTTVILESLADGANIDSEGDEEIEPVSID